jgi:hypothetical protein
MKMDSLRSMICGVVLASFAMSATAMACHNSTDALNPNHKKHHKKAAEAAPMGATATTPAPFTGFMSNG